VPIAAKRTPGSPLRKPLTQPPRRRPATAPSAIGEQSRDFDTFREMLLLAGQNYKDVMDGARNENLLSATDARGAAPGPHHLGAATPGVGAAHQPRGLVPRRRQKGERNRTPWSGAGPRFRWCPTQPRCRDARAPAAVRSVRLATTQPVSKDRAANALSRSDRGLQPRIVSAFLGNLTPGPIGRRPPPASSASRRANADCDWAIGRAVVVPVSTGGHG
jgi:hypothetical protein